MSSIKNVTEEEILRAAQIAFSNGYYHVKLYFMMGLPTETLDDIAGIAQLAEKIINLYFEQPNRQRKRRGNFHQCGNFCSKTAYTVYACSAGNERAGCREAATFDSQHSAETQETHTGQLE